jgi:hypothetical protein
VFLYFRLSPPLPSPPLKTHSFSPLKRIHICRSNLHSVHLHLHFWNSIWKVSFAIIVHDYVIIWVRLWICCNFLTKLCWFWVVFRFSGFEVVNVNLFHLWTLTEFVCVHVNWVCVFYMWTEFRVQIIQFFFSSN